MKSVNGPRMLGGFHGLFAHLSKIKNFLAAGTDFGMSGYENLRSTRTALMWSSLETQKWSAVQHSKVECIKTKVEYTSNSRTAGIE